VTYYRPAWQIALCIGVLALPSSVVVGLAGWWAWRRLCERAIRQHSRHPVRSSGAVIVDIVTGQRGMAILPRDDWNGPLWDTREPIYVPVGQSVTLQATTRVSGMILVGGKIAAISEV
jgi:hypothetical protein